MRTASSNDGKASYFAEPPASLLLTSEDPQPTSIVSLRSFYARHPPPPPIFSSTYLVTEFSE